MGGYEIMRGSQSGWRVIDHETGETASISGRFLDNMSDVAAEEVLRLLERRDDLRLQRLRGAEERNDLAAILDDMASGPRHR